MTDRMADAGRGISLDYEQLGDPAGIPVVLVAGLGMKMHSWPDDFCELLTSRGYLVTRFDNRDVGRSAHLGFPPPRPLAMLRQRWDPRQYRLADMAADTAGLLDALGLPSASLVGISMGGILIRFACRSETWRRPPDALAGLGIPSQEEDVREQR